MLDAQSQTSLQLATESRRLTDGGKPVEGLRAALKAVDELPGLRSDPTRDAEASAAVGALAKAVFWTHEVEPLGEVGEVDEGVVTARFGPPRDDGEQLLVAPPDFFTGLFVLRYK